MALLEVKNLSFTYPRQPKDTTEPKPALSGVSLDIRRGEFMVLCGASGCGKSTLLRLLKRELAPEGEKSGEIIFCGKEQSTLSEREAACEIGYVLQNPENQIVTDKVWHELAFGLENMGVPTPVIRRRVAEMACFFGIDDWFRKKTTELSGGQKQLLNLASILSMQPKLLILDEPTSQLDPIAASDFIHTLSKINKELGLTILLTEHRLEEVFPLADRVAVMDQGKLLFVESPRQAGHELKKFDPNHRMLLGLPSAVRIYQGLDAEDVTCPLTVRDGRNFIEENYNNTITRLEREPEKKEEKDRPIAMRMKDICFRYEKEEPDVLDHVALTLYEGEVVSLLGGNGAGKTTLLSVISGTNRPYYGKIEVFGKRLQKYRGKELYIRKLASLPQNPQTVFLKMTVREDYEELAKVLGCKKSELEDKIQAVAQQLEITHLLERHPYDLSGGEQQRLALAKVLLLRPKILLMDEPTKGMDAEYKEELGEILKKLQQHGITIFMISHDVEFVAEYADRVGLFFEGNIVTNKETREFFAGNSFYTTAANRMARQFFPEAVTGRDVVKCL